MKVSQLQSLRLLFFLFDQPYQRDCILAQCWLIYYEKDWGWFWGRAIMKVLSDLFWEKSYITPFKWFEEQDVFFHPHSLYTTRALEINTDSQLQQVQQKPNGCIIVLLSYLWQVKLSNDYLMLDSIIDCLEKHNIMIQI